jgi:hypothetical protein
MGNASNFDELFNAAMENKLPSGGSFPKVDIEGNFKVKVLEASYGKNQAGTAMRGFVKVEVVESLGSTEDRATARTNLYINVGAKTEHTQINIAPWIKTLMDMGVTAEKIKDDATDFLDIIQNITTIITKQLKQGKEIYLYLSTKNDGKGGLYKNVGAWSLYKQSAPAEVSKPVETKVVEAKPVDGDDWAN